ncbi:MAG: transposase [Gammaproteobacteria bacterium]|nr:transposase [Gammaproteobacteria bacterium]
MARPLRLEFAGALYHITARGDRRELIYEDDNDRLSFLALLSELCQQYQWVCHAYCLMGNHYHLLLETLEANLSSGMRQLNGVYTQRHNRRHERVGHVFQGRYKAILVEKEGYLLELARYIVLNPVRAQMVHSAEEWPWSSYQATVGSVDPFAGLYVDWVLSAFGQDREHAVAGYKRFVASGRGQPTPWEALKNQIYLGGDQFIASVQGTIDPTRSLAEIPSLQRRPPPRPLDDYFANSADRDQAIAAAYASGGYSLQAIGEHVGLHYSRVSRIVKRAKGKT